MQAKKYDKLPDIETIVTVSNWLREYTQAVFDRDVPFEKAKWDEEGEKIIKLLEEVK